MNNLDTVLKIFDLRYSILQERYKIGDIDDSVYGFQLKKLDNELRDLLDNIKEENVNQESIFYPPSSKDGKICSVPCSKEED